MKLIVLMIGSIASTGFAMVAGSKISECGQMPGAKGCSQSGLMSSPFYDRITRDVWVTKTKTGAQDCRPIYKRDGFAVR